MFKEERVVPLRILACLIGLAALVAAVAGIVWPGIYRPLVSAAGLAYEVAQDLVSVAAALILLVTAFAKGRAGFKAGILQIGLVAYLFYGYGGYVIGLLYTYFYFAYVCVFGLSIFYFIVAFTGIEPGKPDLSLPVPLRLAVASLCAAMPAIFAPQWIAGILGKAAAHFRPTVFGIDHVYVLDLSFVLPLCALAAIYLFRKRPLGYLLGGAILVKGFFLMLSVALGGFIEPLFGQKMVLAGMSGGALPFSGISLAFLALAALFLACAKDGGAKDGGAARYSSSSEKT